MLRNDLAPLFRLGKLTFTPAAKRSLSGCDLAEALLSYIRGERTGDARDSRQLNFPFGLEGCRVLGCYRSPAGKKVWIITEADRSQTTVMLPEEFQRCNFASSHTISLNA